MPSPESIAQSRDKYLVHAVAVAINIPSDQAASLLYYQPDLITKMNSGLLPQKHADITRTLVQTTNEYVRRGGSGGRIQQRKKVHIDRQLSEEPEYGDDLDYSKIEGGALGLHTGPSAAQMWFMDPSPQLLEFFQKPHSS